MRLSDIKGDRVIDVVADLIEPVSNIAMDESVTLFKREKAPEGMAAKEFAIQKLRRGAPVLLKTHKADVVAILAAIKGVTPEEYTDGLNMLTLLQDFVELLTDSEFLNLFTSAAQTGQPSGSASETTTVPVG